MNKEKEQALRIEFPALFRNPRSIVALRGIECDDGWYRIIHALCAAVERRAAAAGLRRGSRLWPRFAQIKEKFGTLRVYLDVGSRNRGIHAVDFLNAGLSLRGKPEDRYAPLHAAVAAAEKRSASVCERCGRPGTLRRHRPWLQTLCDRCSALRDEGFEHEAQLFEKLLREEEGLKKDESS